MLKSLQKMSLTEAPRLDAEHGKENHSSCIFCKITRGELEDSIIIAQTNLAMCIMSLEGHPLVIPKAHVEKEDIDKGRHLEDAVAIYELAFELAPHIEQVYGASGYNLVSNLGSSAGQELPHLHTHIIPRKEKDKGMRVTIVNRPKAKDFPTIAATIANLYFETKGSPIPL